MSSKLAETAEKSPTWQIFRLNLLLLVYESMKQRGNCLLYPWLERILAAVFVDCLDHFPESVDQSNVGRKKKRLPETRPQIKKSRANQTQEPRDAGDGSGGGTSGRRGGRRAGRGRRAP